MDIVGTILSRMDDPPASVKNETDNEKPLAKENLISFSLKKENPSKSTDDPEFNAVDNEIEYYWCGICGNLYTDSKNFNNHKRVHEENQKAEGCDFIKQEKTVQNLLSFPLNKENPSKSLDDPVLNADKVQKPSLFKCPVCGKSYTVRKKFNNHVHNHKRNEKKGKKQVNRLANKNTKHLPNSATSGALSVNLAYVPPATTKMDANILSLSSKNVILNPSSHEQLWNCNQEGKSGDVHQANYFLEKSQSKSILPEKEKKSYKCKICDRIFTVRKTYLNHKTNHSHNRNTGKLFFFERGKKQREQIHSESNKSTGK